MRSFSPVKFTFSLLCVVGCLQILLWYNWRNEVVSDITPPIDISEVDLPLNFYTELTNLRLHYDFPEIAQKSKKYQLTIGAYKSYQSALQQSEKIKHIIPSPKIIQSGNFWLLKSPILTSRIQRDQLMLQLRTLNIAPLIRVVK